MNAKCNLVKEDHNETQKSNKSLYTVSQRYYKDMGKVGTKVEEELAVAFDYMIDAENFFAPVLRLRPVDFDKPLKQVKEQVEKFAKNWKIINSHTNIAYDIVVDLLNDRNLVKRLIKEKNTYVLDAAEYLLDYVNDLHDELEERIEFVRRNVSSYFVDSSTANKMLAILS